MRRTHWYLLVSYWAKFYSAPLAMVLLRWVLGGGLGVPCTVNPLYDGLTSGVEASKAVELSFPKL